MRTGQRVSSETVLESFPWLLSSWTVWLEPLWSSQRSKYRKCLGQTITLTLLQKFMKYRRRKLYSVDCCSWLKFSWLLLWKLQTAKFNRHNVQMIEIVLSAGCKLGKCEVCYKYGSSSSSFYQYGGLQWVWVIVTGLSPWKPRATPRPVMELVVDGVALGQVLFQKYLFSISIIPPVLHTNSFISHQRVC
jgi:hypothetical protein